MVIGVAATDIHDQKASFSNYGNNCVDIMAPGKKILTTAFLPSDPSDNILIYGSGTSLAAPIVSGIAALVKSNHMNFTNVQLRDIILNTADNIDAANAAACLGGSCNGFLGHGRINALSAAGPQPLVNGSLVREAATGLIYQVSGGKKQLVSSFVFTQRGFKLIDVKPEVANQLASLPTAAPLMPLDGTLIKAASEPLVYVIQQEVKRPVTALVFQSRGYKFSDVRTIPDAEVAILPTGEWYWPPDGTLVLVRGNPTVYVMDNGVKRPVTNFVFNQRGLSFGKVVAVSADEFGHIPPAPDAYWLAPVDGTLLKAPDSPTVYLMAEGARKPITAEAFLARHLKFSDIKTVPQAELEVIIPGAPLYN
jgi:hypothetical protein